MRSLWVGVAGFFGAITRYQVDSLVSRHTRAAFPWGTLAVNLSGCFLLGVLLELFSGRLEANAALRTAATVGFVGAYTTFSTFSVETVRLAEDGAAASAVSYVAASVFVGLAAAWAGMAVGRTL